MMQIKAPAMRVQAFAVPSDADLENLERQIAALEAETVENENAIRALDAALLADLKIALAANLIIPPELLPPPPPMVWLAMVTEHRAFFSVLAHSLTDDPADVGIPAQARAIRERDPDYYTERTVGGRQEIRARFCDALAGGVVREAVRRGVDDLTLVFKHQPEPDKGKWYEDPYSDWEGLLKSAHAKHAPTVDLELRFKHLGSSGRIVSSFHPIRLRRGRVAA